MPKTSLDRRNASAKSAVDQTAMFTGKTFAGKYRLKSVIGSDFVGTLYKAENIVAGKELAIKVLRRGFFLSSDVVKRIDHPNINKLSKVLKEKDGTTAVIMEVPPGTSVRTLLSKRQKITPGEAVSAALQVLSALHAIHSKRIVVQNLSSESVYFAKDPSGDLAVKLANIGLCDRRKLPEKPSFLSPEVILGGAEPDKRSDIWSVGVLLFETIFGRRPFNGKNQDELVGNILLRDPRFPELTEDVPNDIVAIIEKALEKEPENRYQNVTTMMGDLLPLQEELEESLSEEIEAALRKSLAPPPRAVSRDGAKSKTKIIGKMAPGVPHPKRPVPGAKPARRPAPGAKPAKLPVPGKKPAKLPVPGKKPAKQSPPGAKPGRGPAPGAKTIGKLSPLKPLKPAKPQEETPRTKGTMQFSKDMINPGISSSGPARRVGSPKKAPAKTLVLTSLDRKAGKDKSREKVRSRPLPHIVDTKPEVKETDVARIVETVGKPGDGNAESRETPPKDRHVQVVSADAKRDGVTGDLVTMDIEFEDDDDATTAPVIPVDSEENTIDIEVGLSGKTVVLIGKEWLSKSWKLMVVVGVAIAAYLPKVKGLASKVRELLAGSGNPFSAVVSRMKGLRSKGKKTEATQGVALSTSMPRVKGWVSASKKRIAAVMGAIAALMPKVVTWISKNRRLAAIIGGVAAVLLLVLLVISLSTDADAPSPGVKQAAVLPETKSTSKSDATRSSGVESAAKPKPDKVIVEFQAMPSGARVTIDEREVSLPIELPLSADSVTFSVQAKGYKTFTGSVVPDRDRKIAISMEKEDRARKTSSVGRQGSSETKTASKRRTGKRKRRGRRTSAKKTTSKPQAKRGKLASNPFGD